MASPVPLSSVEAIIAAAHKLKLTRLAASEKADTPVPKSGKKAKQSQKDKKRKAPNTVRCRLQITPDEYRELAKLKKRLGKRGIDTGKGQLVRAGLRLLVHLDRTDLKAAIRDVIAPEPASA